MSELQRQLKLAKVYRTLKFLVIDDFDNFRLSLKQMIRAFGVEVVEMARSGEDATEKCAKQSFDIVLCDYNLGSGKNGQQILEELRFRKVLKHTSLFIMVTAETSRSMVMGALEYQPDGYLTKPVTKSVLQKRLDALIEQREALYPINAQIDRGNFAKAIELCDQEIKNKSRYLTWCVRILGGLHYQNGNYDVAEKVYQGILSSRELGWARLGLGKVYLAQKRYQEAIDAFNVILDENPDVVEACDWLAEAYRLIGKKRDAQKMLEKAISVSPFAILRQQKLGEICAENKDVETAAKAYRSTVKLGQNSCYDSADNYLNLGRCLSDMSEGNTSQEGKKLAKEAVQTLEKATKKFKEDDEVKLKSLLIETRVHKGQKEEKKSELALNKAKAVIENLEDEPLGELGLEFAKTLYSVGSIDEAEKLLHSMAAQAGDDKTLMSGIEDLLDEPGSLQAKVKARKLNKKGIALFEDGDLAGAADVFAEALELIPKHPALNLNLVQVNLKLLAQNPQNRNVLSQCQTCLQNVKHIPPQHRQYKRYMQLQKKVQAL